MGLFGECGNFARKLSQILDAQTKEENFAQNPRGTQIVFAEQLGTLDPQKGFVRYGWLPSMNAPVFLPQSAVESSCDESDQSKDLILGLVPNSKIPVRLDFDDMLEYHTAILGVTGMGKTELAFDIIKHALSKGTKVLCVDFTGEYMVRLAGDGPKHLGLDEKQAKTLQDRLFDVETGRYGTDEKKSLIQFIKEITPGIKNEVAQFLEPGGSGLGIFEIEEIANTKATLRATELYLSTIFDWARRHRREQRILLVLEEAHTIIPETSLFGSYDRAETGAVVGRMAQIALQGRKYGVGILLISQRTALVSKTLLSQCNTVISFALHDETGLKYLSNVFSTDYVSVIPNLKFLQGVVFGKAVRSDRPVIFQIPWNEEKKKASAALDSSDREESYDEVPPPLDTEPEPVDDGEEELLF